MWIIITLVVVLVLLALAHLYGIFTPITTFREKLLPSHILYYSFKGDEQSIGQQFEKIGKDAGDHFKISDFFGIYYSDHSEITWNAVLGIVVNHGQQKKIADFLSQNEKYKDKVIPKTRYIGCLLPYVNIFSFLLNGPRIKTFRSLVEKQDKVTDYLFEIYHFLPTFGKTIQFINPTQNQAEFELFEQP